MYKMRSMKPNAEAEKEQLQSQNRVSGGMMFKIEWDPRVIGNYIDEQGNRKTGIGEFIRNHNKWSILWIHAPCKSIDVQIARFVSSNPFRMRYYWMEGFANECSSF